MEFRLIYYIFHVNSLGFLLFEEEKRKEEHTEPHIEITFRLLYFFIRIVIKTSSFNRSQWHTMRKLLYFEGKAEVTNNGGQGLLLALYLVIISKNDQRIICGTRYKTGVNYMQDKCHNPGTSFVAQIIFTFLGFSPIELG